MYHTYSRNDSRKLISWLIESFERLIKKDIDLLIPEIVQTDHIIIGHDILNRELHETAINHRLACHMENSMEDYLDIRYYCDIEYNRFINQRKMVHSINTNEEIEVRPDIIVHRRTALNESINHLLVIEAKKRKTNEKDRNHVKDLMYDSNYRYKYGLLVSYYYDEKNIECELLKFENREFISENIKIRKIHK